MPQRSLPHRVRSRPAAFVLAACGLAVVCPPARADLNAFVNATAQNPTRTFLATNVSPMPGQVNIGTLSGPNTYEFVVIATGNTSGSLALLGPVMPPSGYAGDAIKFEQYPFTGLYGGTQFGIADYSYTAASRYGAPVVLAFVANPATQTTRLYVDGVDTGSTVPFPVSLSGTVVLGGAWNSFQGYFDVFEGTILAAAAYNSMLSGAEIAVHSQAYYSCYPDCNGDGTLTAVDFGCFQTKFVAGDPYADCNGDGVRTVADFGCFQTTFVAACP